MFISFVGNICGEALKDQIYMIEVDISCFNLSRF